MNASILTRLQRKYKILLIGDDCIDEYEYGHIDRISPEAPVPVFKYSYTEARPGMVSNVEANLKALGCDVVAMKGERGTKTRLIDIRSRQHIVRIDSDVNSKPLVFDHIPFSLEASDAIVISDYNKGYVSYELVEALRRQYPGPIFIDTKKPMLKRFEGCYVKINSYEHSLAKSFPKDLIVTLGAQGAEYQDEGFAAPKIEVVDVCGAGDTFLAALAVGFLDSNNIRKAIEFAIKAASVTVQHTGVYAPSIEEILCQEQ